MQDISIDSTLHSDRSVLISSTIAGSRVFNREDEKIDMTGE